ncbi:MAG: nucleotidyltransferase family protein [Clostridia bacterium]|jgi:predicted nucleotidyltransferase|nr:nucleotidyltransferase family protein [Clostridia bacterium]
MDILSIVSEYNPLHNGHLYHFKKSVDLTSADVKVAIMSGNFVQRGEPAILNKWKRAELALKAGFDLVIELPCVYAISSAENFAYGAMKIADEIKSSFVSFGSECGDLDKLRTLSKLIIDNQEKYIYFVKEKISEGFSYPKSQELVIADLFGKKFADLCKSNNILGLEYLKALNLFKSSIIPITVERNNFNLISSSEIRKILRDNIATEDISIDKFVPDYVFDSLKEYSDNGNIVLSLKAFERELFYILRTCNLDDMENIPDLPDNMISSLKKAANSFNSIEDLINNLKNKSITQARIKRILLYILLGVTKKDIEISKSIIPYIRVIGMTDNGKKLLPIISQSCKVITSVKDFESKCKDSNLLRLLDIDKRATNIYTLAYSSDSRANLDYTTKIITLD